MPHASMRPRQTAPRLFPEDHAREILSSRCGSDVLQVLDDAEHRWLKYRYGALQSALHKRYPERLVLPYTRAMASAMLFATDPKRILILGLGGGSLVRFFLHHYPEAHLTVIEREPICITIAHDFFSVPREHPGLELVAGDARRVVPDLEGPYDLVMMDLYLAHGPPSWLAGPDFFDAARLRMSADGILSANLWVQPDDEMLAGIGGISAAFDGKLVLVPVSGFRNLIVHAFCPGHDVPDLAVLRSRARALSGALRFDLHEWLRIVEQANRVDNSCLSL